MSNQRSQYPHPGPSYHHPHSPPPPPPHFTYAPNPNAVPFYPYPPPSPMTGPGPALAHHVHPPASPRPGPANRGGYHHHHPHPHSLPAHGYHMHYHYHGPTHYGPPQPLTSPVGHPASPYTHPQKFSPHAPVPYSPHFHSQPNGSYPPAWQMQPLSPLPKQLSMLPPPPLPPPHDHSAQPPPQPPPQQPTHPPSPAAPTSPHLEEKSQPSAAPAPPSESSPPPTSPPPPYPEPEVPSIVEPVHELAPEPMASPASEPASEPTPEPESEPASEPASEPVAEPTLEPLQPSTEPASISVPGSPARPPQELNPTYVIWSRKGRPADAPGIIISPRAHPPDNVVQKALQLPSPPPSPKVRPKVVAFVPEVVAQTPSHEPTKAASSPVTEHIEALSSSATETTSACSTAPDTPVPGSPLSTNTSVSLTGASPASSKASKPLETPDGKPEAPTPAPAPSAPPSEEQQKQPSPDVDETVQSAPTPEPPTAPSSAAAPPPAPKPTVPKKSWASMVADTTASSSRLPTSSVVGFSIPASALSGSSSSSGSLPSNLTARPELLKLLTGGPTGPAPVPKIRPRGLINTGNMCFANSVLQVLVYCTPFNRLFSELGKHLPTSQKEPSKTPLVDATVQFLREFAKPDSKSKGKEREEDNDDFYELDSFVPTYIYDVMKEKKRFAGMVGGYQEDAEEFLGFYLDTLEDELLSLVSSPSQPKAKANDDTGDASAQGWLEVGKRNKSVLTRTVKSTESPITRLFGGKFRSILRAPRQADSAMVEDWRALRLDISREQVKTVQDALQYISHPQPVQITIPTRPGQIIEANQQTLIDSAPPILVLHMKRFQYDTNAGGVVKISKQVSYGPDLEIPLDLLAPARKTSQPIKYQLFGILNHHGQSASGGHYTLDVLHPNRDLSDRPRAAWIRIDDELVSDIRTEDVFLGSQERDDRCAYLLFYRRLGAGIPTRTYAQV